MTLWIFITQIWLESIGLKILIISFPVSHQHLPTSPEVTYAFFIGLHVGFYFSLNVLAWFYNWIGVVIVLWMVVVHLRLIATPPRDI